MLTGKPEIECKGTGWWEPRRKGGGRCMGDRSTGGGRCMGDRSTGGGRCMGDRSTGGGGGGVPNVAGSGKK